jgi:hypothetical protein
VTESGPDQPVIFEINTWAWLHETGLRLGSSYTLADVPAAVWDETLPPGIDAVWLMGVWERSPAGLEVAGRDDGLQASFRAALPDLTSNDVVGSPYCVRRYVVDERLGGPEGLAAARAVLAGRGLRLFLDYVPNHVAPDHPWVTEHPEHFVRGTLDEAQADPAGWLTVGDHVLARGKDPYFAPWPDVVQLDAFAPELRAATIATLKEIGAQADGVRCDMAMLLMSDVFAATWGERVGPPPAREFWPEVIEAVRAIHPGMVFAAEAYWDREWGLQQQGFDLCYDKRLYDRLLHDDAQAVRGHLSADLDYQRGLLRFIENHDEPRAAAEFPPGRDRAAAVCIATTLGATLWHEGQREGRRVRLPVFLARRPDEPVDGELVAFYDALLGTVDRERLRTGDWSLLDATGWPDNDTARHLLSWAWVGGAGADAAGLVEDDVPHHVVVINLSDARAQARIRLPWAGFDGATWSLTNVLGREVFERVGEELAGAGLFVDLGPWEAYVLRVTRFTSTG